MAKIKRPIPELKEYLNQDRLVSEVEKASKHGNHEALLSFVNDSVNRFEEGLKKWYKNKATVENPENSEEDTTTVNDLDDLGF